MKKKREGGRADEGLIMDSENGGGAEERGSSPKSRDALSTAKVRNERMMIKYQKQVKEQISERSHSSSNSSSKISSQSQVKGKEQPLQAKKSCSPDSAQLRAQRSTKQQKCGQHLLKIVSFEEQKIPDGRGAMEDAGGGEQRLNAGATLKTQKTSGTPTLKTISYLKTPQVKKKSVKTDNMELFKPNSSLLQLLYKYTLAPLASQKEPSFFSSEEEDSAEDSLQDLVQQMPGTPQKIPSLSKKFKRLSIDSKSVKILEQLKKTSNNLIQMTEIGSKEGGPLMQMDIKSFAGHMPPQRLSNLIIELQDKVAKKSTSNKNRYKRISTIMESADQSMEQSESMGSSQI